jgi:hypothetical protein
MHEMTPEMDRERPARRAGRARRAMPTARVLAVCLLLCVAACARLAAAAAPAPVPLLMPGQPVAWWFVFKFNSAVFPGCAGDARPACPLGGQVQPYRGGQQFVYASNRHPALQKGSGCVGDSVRDPLGATVGAIYRGDYYYVVWNDQFYDDPPIAGCKRDCGAPWGHSKGMLAWDDGGNGVVIQVTTPSWPASGSAHYPRRTDGNTLGCVRDDDVKVSQHFFALRLSHADVVRVLEALAVASVVTDTHNPQIVANGGPADIRARVGALGRRSRGRRVLLTRLSSGVTLIAKPSALHVPPWQLVSAELAGTALRTATWWAVPRIPSTTGSEHIDCWDDSLGRPGAVQIATSGQWRGTRFSLRGGPGADDNHAKIGVSIAATAAPGYVIFGDLNQQGALDGRCQRSQNGRGGLFFVLRDPVLATGVRSLINGATAPRSAAKSSATRPRRPARRRR